MHICHVITRLIVGGAQENTLLSCEGLHRRGHRVTLVSGPTLGPEGSLVGRAQAGGYELIEVGSLRRAVNPWLDARAARDLRTLLLELRPDVVHTHTSKAGILGRAAAFDAGVPLIVHTVHGMSFNRTQPWLVRRAYARLERWAARRCHAILGVADAMADQMAAAGVCARMKVRTVYSGMDLSQFDPQKADRAATRRAWGVSHEHVVVGTVARLFRGKGYEQLLPIMARAALREPRLRFVWVGSGAQRDAYQTELQRRGLSERTILTGLVSPEQIPSLLAGCDLLAHTSQWEGLPRAVVQALLMRVPAVAFAIDGTPEVVVDGVTGRLVRLNDLEGFADALVSLAQDPHNRAQLGAAGRAHCLARFDVAAMVDQLDELYQELAARFGLTRRPPRRGWY